MLRPQIEYARDVLRDIIRVDELPWANVNAAITDDGIEEAVGGAFVCIYSWTFEDKRADGMKLIPLLDMAQHSDVPNIDHESDTEGNLKGTALRDLVKVRSWRIRIRILAMPGGRYNQNSSVLIMSSFLESAARGRN